MKTKREIESFQLRAKYYHETFALGNKTHCAEGLTELLLCSMEIFLKIFVKLPKEIQEFFLKSKALENSGIKIQSNLKRYL